MGFGARAAQLLDSKRVTEAPAPTSGTEVEKPECGYAINEKNEIRVRGRGYWREEARAAFFDCRDAEDVRDAFRRVWRQMEGQSEASQDVVLTEFTAALRRFGQGG